VSRDSAVQGPSSLDSKDLPDQLDHVDATAQQVCNGVYFAVAGTIIIIIIITIIIIIIIDILEWPKQ